MSFFKVVRFPDRPYLHIPSKAFSRYLHSRPTVYKINLLLREDLRYVVRLGEIDNELYITKGWDAVQRDVDIRIKYIVIFTIQDLNTWSITIMGDNGVGLDLLDIPLNYDIPVYFMDHEEDVIIPPPVADEEDQIEDDHVPAVPAFSQKVKINKKVSYKVPPPLAVLADIANRMILNIKVKDQDVHAVEGNRAQGSCLASFFYRFERFLEDQNVLTIKKPLLGSNIGSWTVINSPLKICFNRESQLALSPQWSGSRHSFSFTDFRTILDCQASRTSSIEDGQSSSSYKSGSVSVLISKEEDFLNVTDFMYSAQVADITEHKTVVALGIIKLVNNQWFYMACNHCLRKVESQLEPLKVTEGEPESPREVVTYYCKDPYCNDKKKVIQAYPRYMVLLKEDPLAINVPDEIASFIDKRYAFKINVTDNHINKRFKSYTIKAHTDDEMIITALDEKYFQHEEVIFICDDNVAPSSISNIAKLNADESESKQLKRNLDDSFENQELLTMSSAIKQSSSSNSESTSKGEFDGIVEGKFLIPKKEK
ncbi:hypothetical protein SSX86_020100 [Deinandra increscens subsp. villosa]|uniref:Uncharacterized protein n=1 Tax=Deinandra increscens subsp. villosa TaxID=3103831 RepID=A0AAP0GXV9_9ASTR